MTLDPSKPTDSELVANLPTYLREVRAEVQNSHGTTAAIATGATVTHGLGSTPTQVFITATETGLSNIYISALTSTTFTVNFAGGGSHIFHWLAMK